MKIFVWHSVETLRDWAAGQVVAWGKDLDEALLSVLAQNEDVYNELKNIPPDEEHHEADAVLTYGSA